MVAVTKGMDLTQRVDAREKAKRGLGIKVYALILVVGLTIGLFLGIWGALHFAGYGAIREVEVVVAGPDGVTPETVGTFQVYKVLTYFNLGGNHLTITGAPRPLQNTAP